MGPYRERVSVMRQHTPRVLCTMGVDGLHRLLKGISKPRTASELAGQTLGVDGYGWLHRAAVSCAGDLLRGRPTLKLVEWVDRRVRAWEAAGVALYFVFDGASVPSKARVEQDRAKRRQAARAALASGNGAASAALDISPIHASQIIAYLRARGIPFVVAPYEADSQLVYLESHGFVDAILSEDGDLLVFGAKRLLTKVDSLAGTCIELSAADFSRSALCTATDTPLASNSAGTDWCRVLRGLAVASGCDYSPGIPGIGLQRALALVRRWGSATALADALSRSGTVGPEFADIARSAELAFRFQRVWDPQSGKIVHLTDPTEPLDAAADAVVGPALEETLARRVCRGVVCPLTHTPLPVGPEIARFVRNQPQCNPRIGTSQGAVGRRIASFGARDGSRGTSSPFFASKANTTPAPSGTVPIKTFFSAKRRPSGESQAKRPALAPLDANIPHKHTAVGKNTAPNVKRPTILETNSNMRVTGSELGHPIHNVLAKTSDTSGKRTTRPEPETLHRNPDIHGKMHGLNRDPRLNPVSPAVNPNADIEPKSTVKPTQPTSLTRIDLSRFAYTSSILP